MKLTETPPYEYKPHERRVVDEVNTLNDRINALNDFMHGDIFPNLQTVEQGLLMIQLEAMKLYSTTLSRRIQLFGK